jgi:hypothetical protein
MKNDLQSRKIKISPSAFLSFSLLRWENILVLSSKKITAYDKWVSPSPRYKEDKSSFDRIQKVNSYARLKDFEIPCASSLLSL